MAAERPGTSASYQAAEDLSGWQFRYVKLDANGQIAKITANTDIPFGILQDKPAAAGRAGNVMLDGRSKIVGGANLVKGETVGTDAEGRAISKSVASSNGIVVTDNSVAGGIASIEFDCKSQKSGAA